MQLGGAELGDVMGSRRTVLIHGDLDVPELSAGQGGRQLSTIGAQCAKLGVPLSYLSKLHKRTTSISDSSGNLVSAGGNGKKTLYVEENSVWRLPHT